MRLIPVSYYGFTAMDRRFSIPMLPWIVSEIRKRDTYEKLSLGIEDGQLQAYNSDFEIQFSHKLNQMTRFSQADLDPCTFLYLLRDDNEQLLFCYLFQASKCSDVLDLYHQMKDNGNLNSAPTRSASSAANLTSLCTDISPSSSNFFEVLYIGKIKVWNRKVPETFIDDALEKFKAHDLEKTRKKLEGLKNDSNARRGSVDLQTLRKTDFKPYLQRSQSVISNIGIKSPDVDRKNLEAVEQSNEENDNEDDNTHDDVVLKTEDEAKKVSSPAEIDDHNRTMVLQIDKTDLRLISPDRKVILLQKHHRDIMRCLQGIKSSEHFGFISKEGTNFNTFIGYVFKCESLSVAAEAVGAITQSFNNAETKHKAMISSCEHCPMVWFHKLCCEIENLSDKKTQAAIIRRIEQLDEEEQTVILTKYSGVETDSVRDQNELLMMLLRAHCEMKQGRHVHDMAENRSEFLNHYLGGGNTIFMKAKRSLTTSFDNLLKRRASKDDFNINGKDMTLPISSSHKGCDSSDPEIATGLQNNTEQLLNIDKTPDKNGNIVDKNLKSPMMDIFLKVGSPKSGEEISPNKHETGSYRQAIFKRVVTPSKPQRANRKRSKDELRALWRNSIHQAILLIRMEKENAKLRARQEETAVKRIKLEYDELRTRSNEDFFERLLNGNDVPDTAELAEAVKRGVPRARRGDVWNYLSGRFARSSGVPIDPNRFPNFHVPYENLLKQLTSHQHAILIDLGRTYPSHPYYRSPLGPGQLALFNLLKAYSLLDPEVGYCQGLSFVAGVLLLHMEESQAFTLLRHLMFQRGLRKQYLPDMIGLQIRLYQLSRLLHDRLPDLYEHFNEHEVAPTLYAAPWLLTIFASQFPLGFVARIFDLMFSESTEIVFRVALALLTHYRDKLLVCESFEEVMCFLKNKLPAMGADVLDQIVEEVYAMDISRQLNEYQVEYQVLQEEMQSVQPQVENLQRLEAANRSLTEQNRILTNQVEVLNTSVQRLEQNRGIQQTQINHLKSQNRTLEATVSMLAAFVNGLVEDGANVEIPGDVRRILSQVNLSQRRKSETKNNFLNSVFRKSENSRGMLVKSLSTDRIGENPVRSNGFFSKSYNHIIQRQRTLSESDEIEKAELPIEIAKETLSASEKSSPTNSVDSGVDTSGSPTDEKHPLSSCDVHFTYSGTKELKKLGVSNKSLQRNQTVDIITTTINDNNGDAHSK